MGLPALMTQLLADYAATGVPPAYLAMPDACTPSVPSSQTTSDWV
jgi:hypothetical protein